LDYHADVEYENGYSRKHIKNRKIYDQIDKSFANKATVGVRIYEQMRKFENMDVPYYHDGKTSVQDLFFSPAARLLAAQTIPSIYTGLGTVGIAFGENARYLDTSALNNGMIIDLTAAEILEKNGVDVGLSKKVEYYTAKREYFPLQKRYVGMFGNPTCDISVKEGAQVQSLFISGEKETVGSYTYENSNGQKFLVFAFDGYHMSEHAFRQPSRGEQIEKWIASIGKKLPASMHGNPDCYMLCKESEEGKAVWIGNFFADECMNTTVVLDGEYQEIEFINCSGKLNGCTVEIDDIAPYSSVGFEVR
jgi:hypothetical protein